MLQRRKTSSRGSWTELSISQRSRICKVATADRASSRSAGSDWPGHAPSSPSPAHDRYLCETATSLLHGTQGHGTAPIDPKREQEGGDRHEELVAPARRTLELEHEAAPVALQLRGGHPRAQRTGSVEYLHDACIVIAIRDEEVVATGPLVAGHRIHVDHDRQVRLAEIRRRAL